MGRSERHEKREPEEREVKQVYVDGRWVFISACSHRIHKDEAKTQKRHKSTQFVFA